jgi:hypothetical protein
LNVAVNDRTHVPAWLDPVQSRLAAIVADVENAERAGRNEIRPACVVTSPQEVRGRGDSRRGERAELTASGVREPLEERKLRRREPGPHQLPLVLSDVEGFRSDWA